MSERIKRYTIEALLSDPIVGSPRAYLREQYAPSGDWCRSTDVAAIEAENARLRRIVEAAEQMREWVVDGAVRARTMGYMNTAERINAVLAAYDAAKAQATTK